MLRLDLTSNKCTFCIPRIHESRVKSILEKQSNNVESHKSNNLSYISLVGYNLDKDPQLLCNLFDTLNLHSIVPDDIDVLHNRITICTNTHNLSMLIDYLHRMHINSVSKSEVIK